MSYHREEFVRSRVQALAWLLRNEDEDADGLPVKPLSEQRLDQLVRVLRPTTHAVQNFANAVKIRLRQAILNHPHVNASTGVTSTTDGPLLLARFDKEVEAFARMNPSLVHPFLVLLKPLSFYEPPLSQRMRREREQRMPVHSRAVMPALERLQATVPNDLSRKNALNKAIQDEQQQQAIHIGFPGKEKTKDAPREEQAVQTSLSADQLALHWIAPEVEKKLLVDLVYILQGVTGKHIKYDTRSESYVIDPSLQLHATARDLALCVCELGWLFNKVQDYLRRIFPHTHTAAAVPTAPVTSSSSSLSYTTSSSALNKGLVVQAFGAALQEELQDYYRLLAVLEQELLKENSNIGNNNNKRPSALDSQRDEWVKEKDFRSKSAAETTTNDHTQEVNAGLTLLRLKAWMQEPTERMCLMARLVDGAGALAGGALASRLHAHSRHGDMSCSQLVQRIMDSVCTPIYTSLTRWIMHGELLDPHSEFFIGSAQGQQVKNLWRDSYFLRSHLLPSFIPRSLAEKIMLIGKSINFLKLCLQRLPKDAKSLDSTSSVDHHPKRSLRMINKAKVLTTYGRVMDTGVQETKETLNAMWSSEEEEEDEGGEEEGNEGKKGKEKAKDKTSKKKEKERKSLLLEDVFVDAQVSRADVETALQLLRHGGELRLSEMIYRLSSCIDQRLLRLLNTRFYLLTHLQALKKFMLLGQGDFVTVLMDGIAPELKKRANQLFRHNLTSILEGALRSSNAQYEPSFVVDRVSVRLLEPAAGDSGWEVFSLDYQIDLPLNAIVHVEAMAKYRIAFHMLWRLKRVEWSLASTWKQFLAFAHTHDTPRSGSKASARGASGSSFVQGSQELRAAFHRCHLNRARMMHVINNLCAYLMFEVLESAWIHLMEKLDRAASLDDVIAAHDAYLNEILDRALLSSHHEVLNIQLQQLLQIILRFCHLEETLVADATAYVARQKLAAAKLAEKTRLSVISGDLDDNASVGSTRTDRTRFSLGGGTSFAYDTQHDSIPTQVIARIDETVKEYSAQFDKLMDMLKDESDKSAEVLRFLTFRLDFNDYHENQRQKGKGVGITGTPKAIAAPLALTYEEMDSELKPRTLF